VPYEITELISRIVSKVPVNLSSYGLHGWRKPSIEARSTLDGCRILSGYAVYG